MGCNLSSGCKMAFDFVRRQAIWTFRCRTSYASPTTGSAVFAALQLHASLQTGPSVFFGHADRMLPRQQALRCLRGRNSFASLLTGPSVFSGTGIACFPDSPPCGVCGDATRLRHCQQAFELFRGAHRMLPWQQALQSLGSSTSGIHAFGRRNAFGLQKCIKYANWRLCCKLAFGSKLAFGLQMSVWAAIEVLAGK